MQITPSNLIRWSGLSAVGGGALFVAIQPIHPPEILASFTTSTWAIVHYVGVAMCFLILLGITGIYARQVKEVGWLGLAGFLLFGLMWALTASFKFGAATFRAGVLPRWAGAGLAVGTVAPLVLSLLLPHAFIRLAAIPVGIALIHAGICALVGTARASLAARGCH